ncbi:MAG: tRNA pseudouridine(55) synthase TruB [Balneolaceae bacterium]|nr:MAG: tRNA pseudouridine(55) synthase TruB [Balneolaceae bacterium]
MAKPIPLSELPVINSDNFEQFSPDYYQAGTVILLDKPRDWSSFDLVKYVRNRLPVKKVGHAGTLDPLATGLLIVCTGKATKTISQIQELAKEYVATIKFGESTASYDAAMEPDEIAVWQHITEEKIIEKLSTVFTGNIQQKPPAYSALRIGGRRMYELARKGKEIEIKARPVVIHEIELMEVKLPEIVLRVRCGKGTYIRSLAHDLGLELSSRAHLTALRRTKTGDFDVDDAITPETFKSLIKPKSDG